MASFEFEPELVMRQPNGVLVIPTKERSKAQIDEGERVDVQARGRGSLVVTKVPSIEEVRKRLSGKLPQWSELEGQADGLLEKAVRD